jgi:hypothetical protein
MSSGEHFHEPRVWHLATEREQVGPLTRHEVRQRFADGWIDGEAYAWRDGLADWVRVRSARDFDALEPWFPTESTEIRAAEASSLFDALHQIAGGSAWPDDAHTLRDHLTWHEPDLENTGLVDIRRLSKSYGYTRRLPLEPEAEFALGSSPELPVVPEAVMLSLPATAGDAPRELIRVLATAAAALAVVTILLAALALS